MPKAKAETKKTEKPAAKVAKKPTSAKAAAKSESPSKPTSKNTSKTVSKDAAVKVASPKAEKPASIRKASTLKIDVYDTKGKVVETITLPEEIFGAKINKDLLTQAIHVYQVNQRQGNAQAKTRGQVHGSTKKMGRQKGSGRARHGSIRAPIYVGGGKAHGPQPKDWHLDMPKKMRRAALFSALTGKLQANEIKILSGLEKMEPKTKVAAKILETNYASDTKKNPRVLVVLSNKTENVERAMRNMPRISVERATQLHPFDVVKAQQVLFMKEAIGTLEETFLKKSSS